ncbi:MAG: GTP-binding protein [Chloroflexi bacterium HGW-Chloroflexi-1]|nr:MAG: GTP-binding protein [Chloroflexi bacterium HGW-Chloroflexi-1]
MIENYIPRSLEPVLARATREFPAVVLIGPRQSGKTTLLQHKFGAELPLISLEPPDVRAAANRDPRGFLDLYPPPVVYDEIQYAPDLLPYIKERVDARREQPGQFILTGSQNLLLMQQITESLAGRAAVLKLMPLTLREIAGEPGRPLPWEAGRTLAPRSSMSASDASPYSEVWGRILRGSYPELMVNPQRDFRLWQASYVQTYLERDVRNLRNIGDLTLFQTFLRSLAARSAGLLNLSDLARDVSVAVNTARDWLAILEASFQVFLLRPYYVNLGKRLVKAPKVYFTDTGLLCYLVGLRDAEHAAAGPMGGALLENLVVAELFKTSLHRGEEPALYFWRTAAGAEVDLVVETQSGLIPIEIKAAATARPEMAREIIAFRRDFADRATNGYVIHPGHAALPLGGGVLAWPLAGL